MRDSFLRTPFATRRTVLALSLGAAATALSACGSSGGSGSGGGLSVVTSVYPLAYLVQRIGADNVERIDLASPGVDPHSLELSVTQVAQVQQADVVITIPEFQAAIDDAVASKNPKAELSVYDIITPLPSDGSDEHDHGEDEHDHGSDEHDHAEDDHADEEHSDGGGETDHDEHDHGAFDPHMWHDPLRMADVGDAIAERFAELDADHADQYRERAAAVRKDLEALDADLTEAFSAATGHRVFMTSHAAFGYLADRYDLEQRAIAGIDPEVEPSPQRLLELEQTIADEGITTVFFETTASPEVAEALAKNVGVSTDELDNLETQLDENVDYPAAMRQNAEKLAHSWA